MPFFVPFSDVLPTARVRNARRAACDLLFQHNHFADVRQVAIALGVVDAVTHHELVGDGETNIFDFHVYFAALGFIEQRADCQ
ncbi:Uncharacterised protein [Ewingella americana]|uniref:Uncharacterized protein n=1 Tax=Ewingella americana TaxID=41202 RepID=A0A377NJM1_9GAMM|nr:Uncharacterised protein [Ewingella americana]